MGGGEDATGSGGADEATELRVAMRVLNGWRASYARGEGGPARIGGGARLRKLLAEGPQGTAVETAEPPSGAAARGDARGGRRAGRKRQLAQRAGAFARGLKKRTRAGDGSG